MNGRFEVKISMPNELALLCMVISTLGPSVVHGFTLAQPLPMQRSAAILRPTPQRYRPQPALMSDMSADSLDGLHRQPRDVYVLVQDPVEKRRKDRNSPLRVMPVEPDQRTARLCATLCDSDRDLQEVLDQLSTMPVAIEFARDQPDEAETRTFLMPGKIAVRVRERAREQAGHGGALWGSGIGLSIFLSLNRSSLIEGRSVLELGSGIGLRCVQATCACCESVHVLIEFPIPLLPSHSQRHHVRERRDRDSLV